MHILFLFPISLCPTYTLPTLSSYLLYSPLLYISLILYLNVQKKVLFREYTSPHNVARKYAMDDGTESMLLAESLINQPTCLENASDACEDAKQCFKWLANDEEDRVLSGVCKRESTIVYLLLHNLTLYYFETATIFSYINLSTLHSPYSKHHCLY